MNQQITPRQFHATAGVQDWRAVGEAVAAHFRTGSFAEGARFVEAISRLPGIDEEHHPDIDLRHEGVTVRISAITVAHVFDGFRDRDVELARRISAVARDLGFSADPSVPRNVQVSIDALDIPAVMPFWRAALGYVPRRDTAEDLIDPDGRWPSFWFQRMDAPRPGRNRIHVDVAVPYDQADARVAAALAAGGHRVDERRPWVLADPEGNEACLGGTDW